MLSRRITELFRLLQCSNTDIARFAGCSPSNISRMKSGSRSLTPGSRAILRFAEAIYRYADYENMLGLLGQLCGTEDTRAEALIPVVIGWLFDDRDFTAPAPAVPRSKRELEKRKQSFGERLDRAMTLLEITNSQLAAALNIDVSLVSRYRSGIYHPNRNEYVKERLCEQLLARAERTGRQEELAALCGAGPGELTPEALMEWLYEPAEDSAAVMAEALFRSIDAFTPGKGVPDPPPALPPVREAERYWGTEGLRSAVVRFLTDTAREGGELLLYSDEPMDWMSGDREYFAVWASLMVACVRSGVRIRIIHNVDRIGPEMMAAIQGWFPLYMSGRIEPYVFRRTHNARFCHTVFLRPGRAGITGFFSREAGEKRWYDYVTDRERMEALETGFRGMLAGSSPLLKTYPMAAKEAFWQCCREHTPDRWVSLLHGLSLPTMPEGLLRRMLDRAGIAGGDRERLLARCQERRRQLDDMLAMGSVDELLCLPDREAIARGEVRVNLEAELMELPLTYTPEEYREHAAAVCELVEREKNYHLTLLPQTPFRDLQVFTLSDAVAVLRCREPYTAFVFLNAAVARSVSDYCRSLMEQYAADRFTTVRALEAGIGREGP